MATACAISSRARPTPAVTTGMVSDESGQHAAVHATSRSVTGWSKLARTAVSTWLASPQQDALHESPAADVVSEQHVAAATVGALDSSALSPAESQHVAVHAAASGPATVIIEVGVEPGVVVHAPALDAEQHVARARARLVEQVRLVRSDDERVHVAEDVRARRERHAEVQPRRRGHGEGARGP